MHPVTHLPVLQFTLVDKALSTVGILAVEVVVFRQGLSISQASQLPLPRRELTNHTLQLAAEAIFELQMMSRFFAISSQSCAQHRSRNAQLAPTIAAMSLEAPAGSCRGRPKLRNRGRASSQTLRGTDAQEEEPEGPADARGDECIEGRGMRDTVHHDPHWEYAESS